MRKFKVSALLEGYRTEEFIHAASEHHAIRIMKAKYGDSARNIWAMIQWVQVGSITKENQIKPYGCISVATLRVRLLWQSTSGGRQDTPHTRWGYVIRRLLIQ